MYSNLVVYKRYVFIAWYLNQSINQSAFILPNTKKAKSQHYTIIENITVRAGETPKKTARQSLT